MASFASFNTSDKSTGDYPLQGLEFRIFGPISAVYGGNVAGSVFADQPGVLKVQQSFDGEHFDISQSIPVKANQGQGFDLSIIAPTIQIIYENGATNQTAMRLFAHTFVTGV